MNGCCGVRVHGNHVDTLDYVIHDVSEYIYVATIEMMFTSRRLEQTIRQ